MNSPKRARRKASEIIGARYGRLTVVHRIPGSDPSRWLCRCDCGNEKIIPIVGLRPGKTRSCGCLSSETTSARNTAANPWKRDNETEYSVWSGMISRGRGIGRKSSYADRGITVCDRWKVFKNFLDDMGKRPSPAHSIDRRDNDKGYSPENCRWATAIEQARNRRSNVLITALGETLHLIDWARRSGLSMDTITGRLRRGWPVDEAVSIPTYPRIRRCWRLAKGSISKDA